MSPSGCSKTVTVDEVWRLLDDMAGWMRGVLPGQGVHNGSDARADLLVRAAAMKEKLDG